MRISEGIEVHIREQMVAAATRTLPVVFLNGVFAVLDAAFVSEPGAREGVRDRLPGAGHREIHVTGRIVLPEAKVRMCVSERLKAIGPASIGRADLSGLAGSQVPFALRHAGLVSKPAIEIVGLGGRKCGRRR